MNRAKEETQKEIQYYKSEIEKRMTIEKEPLHFQEIKLKEVIKSRDCSGAKRNPITSQNTDKLFCVEMILC